MQLNRLISLLIIAISIVTIYFILSSLEDKMISNIDREQVISTNTTTKKKIQTPPERINESIINKEEHHKQHQFIKKTPEPKKNETQHPIFEKIGDSTYRISDRSDLSKVAELAAIEFANENNGEDYYFRDFNKATAGDPVSVLDECDNSYYNIVPLYVYNEYAGLVSVDLLNETTIKIDTVFPSSFFQSENLSNFKDKFLPIEKDEAINNILKELNIDGSNIQYNNLVRPCIDGISLSPKFDLFHSFSIDKKKYLVNVRDGDIITEEDKIGFKDKAENIQKYFEK